MKRARILYISLSCLIALMSGCKEQSLELFDENMSGNSIYFMGPYSTALQSVPADSVHARFGFQPVEATSIQETITVQVTGPLYDTDRVFSMSIDPNGTLKEGVHFRIVDPVLRVPAGERRGSFTIEFLKKEEMKTQRLSTTLYLQNNENFNTNLEFRKTPNLQRSVSVIKLRIMADNVFEIPYCWTYAPTNYYFQNWVGDYSKAKLDLIIMLFDEKLEHFTDPQYDKDGYFTSAAVVFWGNYLNFWLKKEVAEGRIHKDENGNEIKAGRYAN